MFTWVFWSQAFERAVKAFFASLGGAIGGQAVFTHVDWRVVFGGSAVAALISICMSVSSYGIGPSNSPSLVDVPCTPTKPNA